MRERHPHRPWHTRRLHGRRFCLAPEPTYRPKGTELIRTLGRSITPRTCSALAAASEAARRWFATDEDTYATTLACIAERFQRFLAAHDSSSGRREVIIQPHEVAPADALERGGTIRPRDAGGRLYRRPSPYPGAGASRADDCPGWRPAAAYGCWYFGQVVSSADENDHYPILLQSLATPTPVLARANVTRRPECDRQSRFGPQPSDGWLTYPYGSLS
jgi:hypothetical protein